MKTFIYLLSLVSIITSPGIFVCENHEKVFLSSIYVFCFCCLSLYVPSPPLLGHRKVCFPSDHLKAKSILVFCLFRKYDSPIWKDLLSWLCLLIQPSTEVLKVKDYGLVNGFWFFLKVKIRLLLLLFLSENLHICFGKWQEKNVVLGLSVSHFHCSTCKTPVGRLYSCSDESCDLA